MNFVYLRMKRRHDLHRLEMPLWHLLLILTQLMPKNADRPGFLFEPKAEKDCTGSRLKALTQMALQQIEDNHYGAEMQSKGVRMIVKYGVAFSGKNVEIAASEEVFSMATSDVQRE